MNDCNACKIFSEWKIIRGRIVCMKKYCGKEDSR